LNFYGTKTEILDFRFYAVSSLYDITQFPESKKDSLGKQLIEIIKNENDKGQLIYEFNLLAKFPSKEAALFLTEQLMREEQELMLRHFAFKALKEMGDSFYNEAAEYINSHGSPEIKEKLTDWENSWDKINISTGK